MTFLEALKTDEWIRPVSWRGTAACLEVVHDELLEMPHTGLPWRQPKVSEMLGEWETVEGDTIFEEEEEDPGRG